MGWLSKDWADDVLLPLRATIPVLSEDYTDIVASRGPIELNAYRRGVERLRTAWRLSLIV